MRIRTITAATSLEVTGGLAELEATARFLGGARDRFIAAGHEVQTVRAATPPLAEHLPGRASEATLNALLAADRVAARHDLHLGLGPAIARDEHDERFAEWAADLLGRTRRISLGVAVASAGLGVHRRLARAAAEAMVAISRVSADGEANFRFAAAALVPAGTPFFPVAWFRHAGGFSVGVESAGLLAEAFAGAEGRKEAIRKLRRRLDEVLTPVAEIAGEIGRASGWRYLGLDVSPAPSLDASIGGAIEKLTGAPFGDPGTLAGCAAITDALRGLEIETCGYSGLMLPVLEDTVLARRAAERRYGVSDLLLYSSVCGTGLDTVPLPGDTPPEVLTGLVEDVAALAVRYGKPLAARLLPIPGAAVGDEVRIDNPHLTAGVVMDPAS